MNYSEFFLLLLSTFLAFSLGKKLGDKNGVILSIIYWGVTALMFLLAWGVVWDDNPYNDYLAFILSVPLTVYLVNKWLSKVLLNKGDLSFIGVIKKNLVLIYFLSFFLVVSMALKIYLSETRIYNKSVMKTDVISLDEKLNEISVSDPEIQRFHLKNNDFFSDYSSAVVKNLKSSSSNFKAQKVINDNNFSSLYDLLDYLIFLGKRNEHEEILIYWSKSLQSKSFLYKYPAGFERDEKDYSYENFHLMNYLNDYYIPSVIECVRRLRFTEASRYLNSLLQVLENIEYVDGGTIHVRNRIILIDALINDDYSDVYRNLSSYLLLIESIASTKYKYIDFENFDKISGSENIEEFKRYLTGLSLIYEYEYTNAYTLFSSLQQSASNKKIKRLSNLMMARSIYHKNAGVEKGRNDALKALKSLISVDDYYEHDIKLYIAYIEEGVVVDDY